MNKLLLGSFLVTLVGPVAHATGGNKDGKIHFPPDTAILPVGDTLWKTLCMRAQEEPLLFVSSLLFFLAVIHTFVAPRLLHKAHLLEQAHQERVRVAGRTPCQRPEEDAEDEISFFATVVHYLGEVEAVFFTWALALAAAIASFEGWGAGIAYIDSVDYTEAVFVVVIMIMAATRPVLQFCEKCLDFVAGIGRRTPQAWWLTLMIVAPIMGSFITEPAAMTIGALLLKKKVFDLHPTKKLAYGTLGLLFVNISVGGTLSHFAAPPVLMVASHWDWDFMFMFQHFGSKAVIGIIIATSLYYWFLQKEFRLLKPQAKKETRQLRWEDREDPVPKWVTAMHIVFIVGTVIMAHHIVWLVFGLLLFIAFREGTGHFQHQLRWKTPGLVGLFLAGLVIHGGLQGWWISPVISSLGEFSLMIGATGLTAVNDNAAITYLATQVSPELSEAMKYAVVAGAVTGGGLTVIANAPNPAGQAILGKSDVFKEGISPLLLFVSSIGATIIMGLCFLFLPW